jgi:two-component system chemotaxis sensor kinase CheA
MDFNRETVLASFLAESEEGLQLMERSLIAVETDPSNTELLDDIFRMAHMLKGNASALDFPELEGFAHVVEDLLDGVRAHKLAVSRELVSLALSAVDALRVLVSAAAEGDDRLTPMQQGIKARIISFANGSRSKRRRPSQEEEAPQAVAVTSAKNDTRNRTLRVHIAKLDQMLDVAGEIAITQGRLSRMIEDLNTPGGRDLLELHRESERQYRDLREQLMDVRMVPVGPMFEQLVRVVRDISQSHNKLARLEIVGGEVEVDTRVLEYLKDPLLHMIRNAIGHGLESPEVRRSKGKPPCGVLTLKAYHSAGNIMIQLSDDGAGFNRQRILAKAKTMGLVEDGDRLADQEVYRLVFKAGFSTAEKVTDLSGRGVGMDIVRRNIDALRGQIDLQSTAGVGSTVTIRLPLTLAIIEGFGVGVGDQSFVIPVDQIAECVELPQEGNEAARAEGILQLRNRPLPFLYLKDHFGLPGDRSGRQNIVVVQHETSRAGLAVDVLYGATQTVIKPLPMIFKAIPGVSGSAILGNGRVALILDIPTLLNDFLKQDLQLV